MFHCTGHEISENHKEWCDSYSLYQKLVTHQHCNGRIEPTMPHKVFKQEFKLTDQIEDLWNVIYKNTTAFKDACLYSNITRVASGPLTALYCYQKTLLSFKEQFTIHFIGNYYEYSLK